MAKDGKSKPVKAKTLGKKILTTHVKPHLGGRARYVVTTFGPF
jgi:hypothetical protein